MLHESALKEKAVRFEKIDKMMLDLGLDAILFTSTAQPAYQVLVKYVAAAAPRTRRTFVFKEPAKEPCLVLPMAGDKKKILNNSWIDIESLYLGNMLPTVLGFIEKLPQSAPRIGWANPGEIPREVYKELERTKAEFIDVTSAFTMLRANKSDYEIGLTQRASDLSIESFEDLIRRIEPGKTEWELVGGAIGFLAERGAEDLLILAQSKKPFAFIKSPLNIPLGETDIFVYSAEFAGPGGYWTQIIRPVFMDRVTHPDAFEIWKVALEAEKAAVDVARPGNRVCDIHYAIDSVIKKHGMVMSYWAGH